MDDASPITSLDAAIDKMEAGGGFATVVHKGREVILMSAERFEAWEDAVDLAAINHSIANPDPEGRITLEQLRAKYDISAPGD